MPKSVQNYKIMLFPGLPFEAIILLKNSNFIIFFNTLLRGFYYVFLLQKS